MARVGFLWFIRFMRTFDLIIWLKWVFSELHLRVHKIGDRIDVVIANRNSHDGLPSQRMMKMITRMTIKISDSWRFIFRWNDEREVIGYGQVNSMIRTPSDMGGWGENLCLNRLANSIDSCFSNRPTRKHYRSNLRASVHRFFVRNTSRSYQFFAWDVLSADQ